MKLPFINSSSSISYQLFLVVLIGVLFYACKSSKDLYELRLDKIDFTRTSILNNPTQVIPPNGIRVNDSLFVDQTEVANIDWKEYRYFTKMAYGERSLEYKSTKPDLKGFIKIFDDNNQLNSNSQISKYEYFHKAIFDSYPVVGVSIKQVHAYSKWRSDKVFDMALIEAGVVNPLRCTSRETNRTIDNFINSSAHRKFQDRITHVPQFYLPKVVEVEIVLKKIQEKEIRIGEINSIERSYNHQKHTGIPIRAVSPINTTKDENILYNILGNVSELINESKTTFGGNYTDSLSEILQYERIVENIPSQKVGFRNFCKWVPIEDYYSMP